VETRDEVRIELGTAAEVCAMTVFFFSCDDLLKLKKPLQHESKQFENQARFFKIATRLPMELQMVLSQCVCGSSRENVLSKDSDIAFRALAVKEIPFVEQSLEIV
jgi:hypothetical protein